GPERPEERRPLRQALLLLGSRPDDDPARVTFAAAVEPVRQHVLRVLDRALHVDARLEHAEVADYAEPASVGAGALDAGQVRVPLAPDRVARLDDLDRRVRRVAVRHEDQRRTIRVRPAAVPAVEWVD